VIARRFEAALAALLAQQLPAAYAWQVVREIEAAITDLVAFVGRAAATQSSILEPPDSVIAYLWRWLCEISNFRARPRTPIAPAEILAWSAGRGIAVEPYEFEALLRLDLAYLEHLPKKSR